ncbi:kelch-like protein 33 [Alligator mississippiensis]|uniref:kelch-like protein 33 n=1 Tax=Alligator mississippiensis TaxID=8496 RepID=UPI002877DF1B|nr:kelch-like protein 33 [Alligator mississippiensis]XP_059587413.1 kelch-like protein 33 [Alligator mississippiensis]
MWPGVGPDSPAEEEEEKATSEPRRELLNEDHARQFFEVAVELCAQNQLVDVDVISGSRTHHAHAVVLAAVSSFFRERLEQGAVGEVDMSQLATPHGWKAILDFAYSGVVETTSDSVQEVVAAAQVLGVPRVVEICQRRWLSPEKEEEEEEEGRRTPSDEQWETLHSIEKLYGDKIGCDLDLEAQGKTFKVHRVALCCGCEFFRAMFTSGMRESVQATPLRTLFSVPDLHLLISFAYSGALGGTWDEILDAAQTALQYQASGIFSLCLDLFQHQMTPETSLDVLSFAQAYDLRQLVQTAEDFVLMNFPCVSSTPKFLDLSLDQLLWFLRSDALYILNELEAFEGALRWLNADRAQRLEEAEKVLRSIRFPLMSGRELKQVRAVDFMAKPGRFYDLLVESLASIPPGTSTMERLPCRIRTTEKVLVICGGDSVMANMAMRCPNRELWFSHRFLSGIGLVKQVEWRYLGEFPDGPRFRHAVVVMGNVLYVVGGKQYYGVRDMLTTAFRFDPMQGSWERLADMSCERSYFAAVGAGGLLYAMGGSSANRYCMDSVECYDPAANAWRPSHPLPAALCGQAACVLDGTIYVSGGCDGSCRCLTALLQYHPNHPPTQRAPMQEERAGHVMEALRGQLYVAGGLRWRDGHGGYADQLACEVYSPRLDTWTLLSPLPHAHVVAASVVLQGELYVLGGYSHNTYRDTHLVHCYHPGQDRWMGLGTLPQAYADLRACVLSVPPALRDDKGGSQHHPKENKSLPSSSL